MQNIMLIFTKLLKSKTLILGWLVFVTGLFSYLVNDQWIAQYPEVIAVLSMVVGLLTNVSRLLTKLPLSLK
jgi:hypothetical protein